MTLTPSQVDAIARRLAEVLDDRGGEPWGDVKTVARELGVQEEWVYENARKLGGVKLGPGKGARWRFNMPRLRRLVASGVLEEDGPPGDAAPVGGGSPGDLPNGRGAPNGSANDGVGQHVPSRLSNGFRGIAPAPAPPKRRPPDEGFDDVDEPMARLDLEGRFTALNPAFTKLIGYTEEQFARARWPSPHDRHDFEAQSRSLEALATGQVGEVPFHSSFVHGQGLVVRIHGRIAAVRGDDGRPAHLLLRAENRPV